MTTRRKLTLINGMINKEGEIQTYWATNSFEVGCMPGVLFVPPLPFPDDDDWDDFDQADGQDR